MPYYPPGGSGAGAAEFTAVGAFYRLPTGKDSIGQLDPSDGTEASIYLGGGYLSVLAHDNGSVNSGELILDGTSGEVNIMGGFALLVFDADFTVSLGAAGRHIMLGGVGVQFPELAADPGSPSANQTYYNTSSNKLRCYNGTTWNDLY